MLLSEDPAAKSAQRALHHPLKVPSKSRRSPCIGNHFIFVAFRGHDDKLHVIGIRLNRKMADSHFHFCGFLRY